MKNDILKWWTELKPLNLQEKELIERVRETDVVDYSDTMDYNLYAGSCKLWFNDINCSLVYPDWNITVDNCASYHIDKLFNYYVDDNTLVIISNAEHTTTVRNFNECKNGLVLDFYRDILGYNYKKIIDEAKKYEKVFFYCIGTQISTGEYTPQSFFIGLKEEFDKLDIYYTLVLDAVQEMFLQPRDYSIFDYVIGTGHAICWNYDLGILIHKSSAPVKGCYEFSHMWEFHEVFDKVIKPRKDKINVFTRCIHEYFRELLQRPEFSIIPDNAPQLCSIRCKNIYFDEEEKELLDKYEIRIENIGNPIQYIRFRAQMYIKEPELLLQGVEILDNMLKEKLG